MSFDKNSLLLYAVTDRVWTKGRSLATLVEASLGGGATMIQLREKDLDEAAFLAEATALQALCRVHGVPLIINDNISVALESGADGLHIGQQDLSARDARTMLGADKILGVSVQTVAQALTAVADGADYLGVGAVFATISKNDADTVSFETLQEICHAVPIPVVAIGGIDSQNILSLSGSGIAGVAVISAIYGQEDIPSATRTLLKLSNKVVQES